jgi:hypothetical protein
MEGDSEGKSELVDILAPLEDADRGVRGLAGGQ